MVRPKGKPSAPEAGEVKTPEHVVYTFEDDAKMKEFALMWQKRQAMLLRMSVLKSYWDQEEATLNQLNKNLVDDYHLDLAKSYTLDAPRRVILEREAAAPSPAQAPAPASANLQSNTPATATP